MADPSSSDLRDRPIGDLLKQLSQETATLVRKELELAKAELTQRGKRAGLGIGLVGAAGVVGFLAALSLTLFLIFALADMINNDWLAALIVALLLGATAGVLALQGKDKVQEATPPAPQTVETVKEDIEWAKNPTKSVER